MDLTDHLDVPLMRRDPDTPADLAAVTERIRALPRLHEALRAAGWTGNRFAAVPRSVPA